MVRGLFFVFSVQCLMSSAAFPVEVGGELSTAFAQNLNEKTVLLSGGVGSCAGVIISENVVLGTARCANAQRVRFSDGSTAAIDFSVTHPEFKTLTGQTIDELASRSDAVNDIAIFHFTGASPAGTGWWLKDVGYFPVSTNNGKEFSYFLSWGSPMSLLSDERDFQKVVSYYPLEKTYEIASWGIAGAPIFGVSGDGTKGALIALTVRPAFSRKPNGSKSVLNVALIGSPIVLYENWISEWVDAFLVFDELYYLKRYPEVAEQVKRGKNPSGLHHYFTVGESQDLSPSAVFDPEFYAGSQGREYRRRMGQEEVPPTRQTKFRQWMQYGLYQGVLGNSLFDLVYYLAKYPDVLERCASDPRASCGLAHFLDEGIVQNRIPSAALEWFNEAEYLNKRPETARAVQKGALPSAMFDLFHYRSVDAFRLLTYR